MSDPALERDDRLGQVLAEAFAEMNATGGLDRAAFQARHPELAEELEGLLGALVRLDRAVTDWKPIWSVPPEADPPMAAGAEELPARIGRYRILGLLGQGGMGLVYRAHDPELDRVVALKMPKIDDPETRREQAAKRFLREARSAARVRHPHVCPIYDVGEHDGRPFVVMDMVPGKSLARRLAAGSRFEDVSAAVTLVVQVAEALEAVHACDLVHRDLKPGNILIDGQGRAVLTDFGLARPLRDEEHLTVDGWVLGTPGYMAPEQAAPQSGTVGPRTDLYSLGVVLYQMVTGRLPFEGSVMELIHRIPHETPPAPSTFRGDLDPKLETIILRAMARNPEDRHASAHALADDLRRWLTGRPVEASTAALSPDASGPPTPTPSTQTPLPTVVRSELPGGGSITVTIQPGQTTPEKLDVKVRDDRVRKRRRRLAISVTVAFSLVLVMVASSHLIVDQWRLRRMIAQAEREHLSSEELLLHKKIVTLNYMGELKAAQKKWHEAEAIYRDALALSRNLYPKEKYPDGHPDLAISLNNLGSACAGLEQSTEAEALWREALRIQEMKLRADHPDTLASKNNLATLYQDQGKYDQAEPLYREILQRREQILGADHPDTLNSKGSLAALYKDMGKYERAELLLREVVQQQEKKLGADHPDTLSSQNNLATLYQSIGEYDKALPLFQRGLEQSKRLFGENHPNHAQSLNNLGELYLAQGTPERALSYYQKALAIQEKLLSSDHPEVASTLAHLAAAAEGQGQKEAAAAYLRRSLEIRQKTLGKNHPLVAQTQRDLDSVLAAAPTRQKGRPAWQGIAGSGSPRIEMATLASEIKDLLRERGVQSVALGAFTGPRHLPSSAGPALALGLHDELTRAGAEVRSGADLSVEGQYEDIEDRKTGRLAVALITRILDRDGNVVAALRPRGLFGDAVVSGLLGVTVDLPTGKDEAIRDKLLRDSIDRPAVTVRQTTVQAPGTPLALEVLVRQADGGFQPRPAEVKDGLAYVQLKPGEVFRLRLVNNADYEMAVALTIDGLNVFSFWERAAATLKEPRYFILSPRGTSVLNGWPRTATTISQFVVAQYADSAARIQNTANVGTITATFAACWPKGGTPPPDEPMNPPLYSLISASLQTRPTNLERDYGVVRGAVSVRYRK